MIALVVADWLFSILASRHSKWETIWIESLFHAFQDDKYIEYSRFLSDLLASRSSEVVVVEDLRQSILFHDGDGLILHRIAYSVAVNVCSTYHTVNLGWNHKPHFVSDILLHFLGKM